MRTIVLVCLYCVFAGAAFAYYVVTDVSRDLPKDLRSLIEYQPNRATLVYASDGQLIGEFSREKRITVPPDSIPRHVVHAFVAAEDNRFWNHPGFDLLGIARAAYANLVTGYTQQGASTITQQVTRMLLLSRQQTFLRKLREIILSVRIERELSKEQILSIYLNHVFLGSRAYGVQAASNVYFGKDISEMTVAEAALLAGLVKAPSTKSPKVSITKARHRQKYVLQRMLAEGYIDFAGWQQAQAELVAIVTSKSRNNAIAPYFVETVRRWAIKRYGLRRTMGGGLRIHTSLNVHHQRAADMAVQRGLQRLDAVVGFRGPEKRLTGKELSSFVTGALHPVTLRRDSTVWTHSNDGKIVDNTAGSQGPYPGVSYLAVVSHNPGPTGVLMDLGPVDVPLRSKDASLVLRWRSASKGAIQAGDLLTVRLYTDQNNREVPLVSLVQVPAIDGALVAIEPQTGRVTAMVGGYGNGHFNRATQARRQVGSAIKPFVYAAALTSGLSQTTRIEDRPIRLRSRGNSPGGYWTPKNADGRYRGWVTLRTALLRSINTVSVRLLQIVGIDAITSLLPKVGIRSKVPHHPSLALGTAELSPLELTTGYATLARGGVFTESRFVDYVTDDQNTIVDDFRSTENRVAAIDPAIAYTVTDMMTAVISEGTAQKAQILRRPIAGKTGTTNDYRDAWFAGYSVHLVCGVWVGRDKTNAPIADRATGGTAALPIWIDFMQRTHEGVPFQDFSIPEDVFLFRSSAISGKPLPPKGRPFVPFFRDVVPEKLLRNKKVRSFADIDF